MSERAKTVLGADGVAVAADTGCGGAWDIVDCMDRGIEPHTAGADFDARVPAEVPPPPERGGIASSMDAGYCLTLDLFNDPVGC